MVIIMCVVFLLNSCWSYVGMLDRGRQQLSLAGGCWYKGTVVHEIGNNILTT